MSRRRRPDFLESYLEFIQNTESPLSYHTWAGISVVASALERKVFIRWGHTSIYPNLYIVLIGPSGVRKGEPVRIARQMLEAISIPLIAEAITKEALIRRMKNAIETYTDPGGKIRTQCAVSCNLEELATFLADKDSQFLADMTQWYDSGQKWTYETKNVGIDEVTGVCFNLLASMAPDWIPTTIPPGAIGGGFTSRIIFVVEYRKGKTISNPNEVDIDHKLREDLEADLETINLLSGDMHFDKEALNHYEYWYIETERHTAAGRPALIDPRFSGYVSRRATHIKKIAMCISASRSDSLVITDTDFTRSLKLLELAESNMSDVFGKIGKSLYAEQTHEIMEFIKGKKTCWRSEVMQQFYRDVDGRTMEVIESTLRTTGFVKIIEINSQSLDVRYEWKG